jgi:hypothetical protein
VLEFGGGLYGDAPFFGAHSEARCFAMGEGLPGQAWEQGHPIVLKQLEGTYFQRTAAAKAAGLTCGIAVPIFAGDFLTSVLVLFCGDDQEHAGAIELWHNDPAQSVDMKLVDGYYGTTAEVFEFTSRHTTFRRGSGLPGAVWESGMPLFIGDLGKSKRFLRADSATKVGINRGFAIPCPVRDDQVWVLDFLSALGTPIARRFEVWTPDPARMWLRRTSGFCEVAGNLEAAPAVLERGQGSIGRVFVTGVPAVSENATTEPAGVGAAAQAAGLQSLVALPVIREGRLLAVVAWFF